MRFELFRRAGRRRGLSSRHRRMHPTIAATIAVAAVVVGAGPSGAFDDSKYPDFSGQWRKPPGIGNQWDQTKPLGRAQNPPFTPEYQAIFEASLADIEAGGQGNDAPSRCVPF